MVFCVVNPVLKLLCAMSSQKELRGESIQFRKRKRRSHANFNAPVDQGYSQHFLLHRMKLKNMEANQKGPRHSNIWEARKVKNHCPTGK